MKAAKFAITTEKHLEGIVDLASGVHYHVVEGLSGLGSSRGSGLLIILGLFSLRLGSKVNNAACGHLSLNLELQGLNRLESG